MTHEKCMYFWHRHLEGADPKTRTKVRWNRTYRDDPTTVDEIRGVISAIENRPEGTGEGEAMQALCEGKPKLALTPKKPPKKKAASKKVAPKRKAK